MQNVISNAAVTAAATLVAVAEVVADNAQAATALLDAPAAEPVTETPAPAQPQTPAADPLAEVAALFEGKTQVEYTREQLMDARTYTLLAKRSAKQHGFGDKVGPMLRDTVGYKFDGMDILAMLKEMASADFLDRYKATCEKWYNGLSKSATEATLKANKAKFEAAMALFADRKSYARLVKSLLILCQRNQSWMETGSNVALPYNGHKAVLDLFGITVTNNRRLSLSAN